MMINNLKICWNVEMFTPHSSVSFCSINEIRTYQNIQPICFLLDKVTCETIFIPQIRILLDNLCLFFFFFTLWWQRLVWSLIDGALPTVCDPKAKLVSAAPRSLVSTSLNVWQQDMWRGFKFAYGLIHSGATYYPSCTVIYCGRVKAVQPLEKSPACFITHHSITSQHPFPMHCRNALLR